MYPFFKSENLAYSSYPSRLKSNISFFICPAIPIKIAYFSASLENSGADIYCVSYAENIPQAILDK
jgi:hypothetical protein